MRAQVVYYTGGGVRRRDGIPLRIVYVLAALVTARGEAPPTPTPWFAAYYVATLYYYYNNRERERRLRTAGGSIRRDRNTVRACVCVRARRRPPLPATAGTPTAAAVVPLARPSAVRELSAVHSRDRRTARRFSPRFFFVPKNAAAPPPLPPASRRTPGRHPSRHAVTVQTAQQYHSCPSSPAPPTEMRAGKQFSFF